MSIPDPLGYGQRAVDYLRSLCHPKSRMPDMAFQLDDWQEDIGNALRTSDSIAWAYTERFEWVGNPGSGKPPPPTEWLDATSAGRTAGQAP